MTEEHLFELSLQAPEAERAALLDRECAGKPELRARVEALLSADAEPKLPLDAQAHATASYDAPEPTGGDELVGKSIGPYKLLEKIGVGGFGMVFVAEQTEPVRRKVALKVIKPGMDSAHVIARFEAERQALALMDHPNIARVLDAGKTDTGHPYFVMELVRGIPITSYCDQNQLPPRDRLMLFAGVCQAVQHAHQKGIIHRDIKPSNVLVTSLDSGPVAKVIDFGVAKALHQKLTDRSIYTGFAQMIGTPLYMSPEQAEMRGEDIDTRTDIYSLGVLLYELLTGTTPFDRQRFARVAFDEIRRVIREEEPPKPSTRLSSSDSIASVSALRRTEPGKLTRLMRGDLDWITMKCLEKDRTRRYETANGLARDIQRYLADEPVEACPPSRLYRMKKWARKNRAAAYLATVTAICAAAVVVILLLSLREIRRERDNAIVAAEAERQARDKAEDQRKIADAAQREAADRAEGERRATEEAQARLKQAIAANDVLRGIFHDLNLNRDDAEARPLPALLGERLSQAASQLETLPTADPLIKAHLQADLAVALIALGHYDKAAQILEGARKAFIEKVGPDHPNAVGATSNLAMAYQHTGHYRRSLELFEECQRRTLAQHGPDDPRTLRAIGMVALAYHYDGQPVPALQHAQDAYDKISIHRAMEYADMSKASGNLANALAEVGRVADAIAIQEKTFQSDVERLGPDHMSTLANMNNLANSYMSSQQHQRGIDLFRETLRRTAAKLGPDHPHTLQSQTNLAIGLSKAGQNDEAITILEETLKRLQTVVGLDHPYTHSCIVGATAVYMATGRAGTASSLLEDSYRRQVEKYGKEHPRTLQTQFNLAKSQENLGRIDAAMLHYRQLYDIRKRTLPPTHTQLLSVANNLAACHLAKGQYRQALPLFEENYRGQLETRSPDSAGSLEARSNLARCLHELGRRSEARQHFLEIFQLTRQKHELNSPIALSAANNWAHILQLEGKLEEALAIMEDTLQRRRQVLGENHPDYVNSLHNLAGANLTLKRIERATELYQQTVALSKAVKGPEHIDTLRSIGQLARCHYMADRLDLSIPMYEELLRCQRRVLGESSPETRQSMISLAVNYDAKRRPDDALPLFELAVSSSNKVNGPEHLQTLNAKYALAVHHQRGSQLERAISLLEELLPKRRKILGDSHADVLLAERRLGECYRDVKRYDEAITMLSEVDRRTKDNRMPTAAGHLLISTYIAAGRNPDAVAYLRKQLDARKEEWPPGSTEWARGSDWCGAALYQWKAPRESEQFLRDSLAIRLDKEPDNWTTFNTMSILGGALLDQKKLPEAEPLLLKGYEGLKQREKTLPESARNRLPLAIDRLVALYTAMERPDDVKRWQAEREKYPPEKRPSSP